MQPRAKGQKSGVASGDLLSRIVKIYRAISIQLRLRILDQVFPGGNGFGHLCVDNFNLKECVNVLEFLVQTIDRVNQLVDLFAHAKIWSSRERGDDISYQAYNILLQGVNDYSNLEFHYPYDILAIFVYDQFCYLVHLIPQP